MFGPFQEILQSNAGNLRPAVKEYQTARRIGRLPAEAGRGKTRYASRLRRRPAIIARTVDPHRASVPGSGTATAELRSVPSRDWKVTSEMEDTSNPARQTRQGEHHLVRNQGTARQSAVVVCGRIVFRRDAVLNAVRWIGLARFVPFGNRSGGPKMPRPELLMP